VAQASTRAHEQTPPSCELYARLCPGLHGSLRPGLQHARPIGLRVRASGRRELGGATHPLYGTTGRGRRLRDTAAVPAASAGEPLDLAPLQGTRTYYGQTSEGRHQAIDRVSAVAINEETKSKAIKLIIESNKISLSVDSTSRGSAIEEIDLDYNNEKVEIGFNSRYLIDICNEIDGDKINLKFLNSTSPAIILDNTDENLFFVLMPMRI